MVLSAAAAAWLLRAVGAQVELKTVITAAVITTLAAEAAVLPVVLARNAAPVVTSQAALVGTMLHLFLTFVLGAAAYLMNLVTRKDLFLFLLLGFYWVSLIFIVLVMIRFIRRSATSAKSSTTTTPTVVPH
jgi:hypothetical protein